MRNRRVLVVALLALIGLGCWWALRSEPTSPAAQPSVVVEKTREADDRREIADRRRAERAARKEAADDAAKSDSADGVTLTVRVVVKEKGDAVAGANVVATDDDSHEHAGTTDAAGTARIEQFEGDYARIRTTAPGFTRGHAFATKDEVHGDAPIVVEVEPAVALDGVVREETGGHGIAGAKVAISTNSGTLAEAVTAGDGSFHLDGVPASGLMRSSDRVWPVRLYATEKHHVAAGIQWKDVSGAAPIEIRMAAAGILHGRVVGPDGAPAPWANVTAQQTDPDSHSVVNAQTDADGRYEMSSLPLGRKWRVVASKPTFNDSVAYDDVVLDVGRTDAVCDFALQSPAGLDVHVLGPDGGPVAGALVRLLAPGGIGIDRTSGADGACHMEILAPGKCVLGVEAPGFGSPVVEVELATGDRRSFDVRLEPSATFAGVVVDDVGAPIAGAAVSARSVAGAVIRAPRGWTHDAVTRRDGSFRIDGLAAGDLSIDVSVSAGHEYPPTFPATAPTTGARFVLRRLGGVSFRLRVPSGAKSPEGCSVLMAPTGGQPKSAFSSWAKRLPDGTLRFPVKAGAWSAVVFVDGYLPVTRTIDVAFGEDTSLGEIVLDPGLTLEGRVVDAEGRPVAGAFVADSGELSADDVRARRKYRARLGVYPLGEDTDPGGAFRIEHVEPGKLTLTVLADGYADATVSTQVAAGAAPLVITLHR